MLEIEFAYLQKFGLNVEAIKNFQVLCLPENFEDTSLKDDLFDANDSVHLSKRLKSEKVTCANSKDLGLDCAVLDRRGEEFWFGLVYILEITILPLFLSIIGSFIYDSIKTKPSGQREQSRAHIKLKIRKGDNFTSIKYDGDAKTLVKIIESMTK